MLRARYIAGAFYRLVSTTKTFELLQNPARLALHIAVNFFSTNACRRNGMYLAAGMHINCQAPGALSRWANVIINGNTLMMNDVTGHEAEYTPTRSGFPWKSSAGDLARTGLSHRLSE